MKKLLFGTTALVGALALAGPVAAQQTFSLGGELDLEITGESDFKVEFADEDFRLGDDGEGNDVPRSWAFNQDTEVAFIFTGVGDATGIEYGANIQMDIGSGSNVQFDETWMFFESTWGEVRLGNDDAVTDTLRITSNFVERGSGGLDGDGRVFPRNTRPEDGDEATKIIYYTPQVAGFQGGISYAINNGDFGTTGGDNTETTNHIDVGANYLGEFGGIGFGFYGGLSTFQTPKAPGSPDGSDENALGWQIGATANAFGFEIAGSYWDDDLETQRFLGNEVDNAWNVAVATELAGVGVSLAYQGEEGVTDDDDADIYGGSADVGILPGVALQADIFYVDEEDVDGLNALVGLNIGF